MLKKLITSALPLIFYNITVAQSIPPDFNPAQGVLLIEDSTSGKQNTLHVTYQGGTAFNIGAGDYANAYLKKSKKRMAKYADKHYPYAHEFVPYEAIYDSLSAYSDRNKYRFALVISVIPPKVGGDYRLDRHGNMQMIPATPGFQFHLYDRLNNKMYEALGNSVFTLMATFSKAIDKLTNKK